MNTPSIGNHPSAPTETPAPRPATEEERDLMRAVRAVNAAELFGYQTELTFVVDRETRRMLVRIVNRETGEVVNQFPPEYVLQLAEENRGNGVRQSLPRK